MLYKKTSLKYCYLYKHTTSISYWFTDAWVLVDNPLSVGTAPHHVRCRSSLLLVQLAYNLTHNKAKLTVIILLQDSWTGLSFFYQEASLTRTCHSTAQHYIVTDMAAYS